MKTRSVLSGDLFMDGASLFAFDGATMDAPTLRSYSHGSTANSQVHGFQSVGADSRINLPNLEMIVGGTHYGSDVLVEASDGAHIDMPTVRQMLDVNTGDSNNRAFLVRAMGAGSSINLAGLQNIVDINGSSKTGNGEYSRLYVSTGGAIQVPSLEAISGVYYDLDSTSTLDLPNLARATEGRFEFDECDTSLSNLAIADGTEFVLSESTLQANSLETLRGGSVQPSLESTLQAPGLSDIDESNLFVADGSTLSLPSVTSYAAGTSDRSFHVEGVGTSLALNGLQYLVGGSAQDADFSIEAVSEGQLDLSSVQHLVDPATGNTSYRKIRVLAYGENSRIDLSSLESFTDANGTAESGSGEWSELIEANGGVIDLTWDTIELSGVNVVREAVGMPAASLSAPAGDSTIAIESQNASSESEGAEAAPISPTSGLSRQNVWIGQSGDWSEPTNWSQGSIPEITDTVVIPAGNDVTVTISSGTIVLNDLDCSANLNLSGGTLKIKGTATIAGALSAGYGATIVAEGTQANLTANSTLDLSGVNLWSLGGGVISLPTLTEYRHVTSGNNQDHSFKAEGSGSRIELLNLTSIQGGTHYDSDLTIKAINGGVVDLPQVTHISEPSDGDSRRRSVQIVSSGWNSRIHLDSLVEFVDLRGSQTDNGDGQYSQLQATEGGAIQAPLLQAVSGVWLSLNENSHLTALSEIGSGRVDIVGSASLPSLTSLSGVMYLSRGAQVVLPNLSAVNGVDFYVNDGSTLSLPMVTSVTNSGDTVWEANGVGSKIDLSNLTTLNTGDSLGQDIYIRAYNGGEVDLSSVQHIMDTPSGSTTNRSVRIIATGAESVVRLDALETFEDRYAGDITHDDYRSSTGKYSYAHESSRLEALDGGTIALGSLTSVTGVYMPLNGTGTLDTSTIVDLKSSRADISGNQVDFPALDDAASTTFTISDINVGFPALRSANSAGFTVNNVDLDLSSLTSAETARFTLTGSQTDFSNLMGANGTDFYAYGGSQILLPSLTAVTNNGDTVWEAEGVGSKIDLSNLTTLNTGDSLGQDIYIRAYNGGEVDLSSVQHIMDTPSGSTTNRSVRIIATGAESVVRLDALETFEDRAAGDITHDDYGSSTGKYSYAHESSRLEALDGGTIALGSLTSVTGVYMPLDGTGTLDTSTIVDLKSSQVNVSGAAVDFSALVSIYATTFSVEFANIDLSSLRDLRYSTLTAAGDSELSFPVAVSIDGSSLSAYDRSALSFPSLRRISHGSTANNQTRKLEAVGYGSKLDLHSVETITGGTHYGSRISVRAIVGGTVDLSGLERYEDPSGGDARQRSFDVLSEGAGSEVLVTSLRELRDRSVASAASSTELNQWRALRSGSIVVGVGNELQIYGTTVTLQDGGNFVGDLRIASGSYLVGDGAVEGSVANRGQVNPTGFLHISDSYTQSALASIRTSIGGSAEGEYGRGIVSRTATIDGIAEAELVGGFVPETGDVYNFLVASEIVGQFRQFVDVNSGGGWGFEPEYISDASGDRVVLNATFSTGARITNVWPSSQLHGSLTHIDVTFSEPIQPASLSADDVELLGPSGDPIAVGKPYHRTGNTYRIPVQQQQLPGSYSLRIGPNVLDLGGNVMNQNGNLLNGEDDDVFVHAFELIDVFPPQIASVSPTGLTNAPVESIRVVFSESIDPTTFTTDDIQLIGPDGVVDVSGASIVPLPADGTIADNQGFDVLVSALTLDGPYQIAIWTNITDMRGNTGSGSKVISGFVLDTTSPTVISCVPSGDLGHAVDAIELQWSEPIQPDALTASKLTLTGPVGEIPISSVEFVDATSCLISFALQSTNGTYTLQIDPVVCDMADNPMDAGYSSDFAVKLPDFAVSDVSVAEEAGTFGSLLHVQWYLADLVEGSVLPAEIDVEFLLTQAGTDALVLSQTIATNTLGAISTDVPLPLSEALLPGEYQVTVRVNPQQLQDEPDFSNNVAVASGSVDLDYPDLPDLAVSNITTSDTLLPDAEIELAYDVSNGSFVPAEGNWCERVWLSTDDTLGDDILLAEFARTGTLGNESVSRQESVAIPATGISGNVFFLVEIDTSEGSVFDASTDNNTAASVASYTIPNTLALYPERDQVREQDAQKATRVILSRFGNISSELLVSLATSDTSELVVPENVMIPAGVQSVTFWADAVSDGIPDGSMSVEIGATADGHASAAATVTMIDSESPSLTLHLTATEVAEGDVITATVEANRVADSDIQVTLFSTSGSQFDMPDSVIIPAGQQSISFEVTVRDDEHFELEEQVGITARAFGHEDSSVVVSVFDNDEPELTLTLSSDVVSEADGPMALLATVARTEATDSSLEILLWADEPSQVSVPSRVVIPPNALAVSFFVAPVADGWADGPQNVTLTAAAVVESCGCGSTNGSLGYASIQFTVEDSDDSSLFVSFNRDLFAEGIDDVAIATIIRNGATDEALTLTLTTDNADELAWSEPVVIPTGETTITVPLDTVFDDVHDGPQTVRLTVSAPGYASGHDTVVVTDIDLPDLRVSDIVVPSEADTESYQSITYKMVNEGIWEAVATNARPDEDFPGSWTQRVYLSDDPYIGDDLLVGSYTFSGSIPVDQWFERAVSLQMPIQPGEYWVVVQADSTNLVEEGVETNNISISQTPIEIFPAYSATVQAVTESAPAGSVVEFVGHATNRQGQPAASVPVNLHIKVRGIKRVITALTDENGDYAATFCPLSTEAGHYTVGASHPGVSQADVQDTFTLFGMRVEPGKRSVTIIEEGTAASSFTIRNMSDIPLTGLDFEVLSGADNLDIELIPPDSSTLPGSGTAKLKFRITALDASIVSGRIVLRIMADDVQTIEVPVDFRVKPLLPNIVSSTSRIYSSMLRGEPRVVDVTISNNGGRETDPIDVLLPDASWLSLVNEHELPSLAPGESASISLLLTPPSDMALTYYEGKIQFRAEKDYLNIPFKFRAVSEATGNLSVTAFDDLFFYTEEAPKLAGASIRIVDAVSGQSVASLTTDDSGAATIENLPEGYYDIEVRAAKHNKYTETLYLAAGITNTVRAFLPQQAITYTWTVRPVEIEDRYEITIETVFETNVPAPVVSVSPSKIDVSSLDVAGDHMQVNVTLENSGLIAAPDVELHFDEHPMYRFTPLVEDLGDLAAKSSVVIPVLVERLAVNEGPQPASGSVIQSAGERIEGLSYAAAGNHIHVDTV